MTSEVHISLLVLALLHWGINAYEVRLSPATFTVVENTSVTLTCSGTHGPLSETRWINSQIEGFANLYILNQKCIKTNFLANTEYFNGVCNNDGTYSVDIKRVDRFQDGAKWHCLEHLESSNKVTINVTVPVSSVDIFGPSAIYMQENSLHTIKCEPSACRPNPTIRWYIRNPRTNDEYNIVNSTQSHDKNNDGLIAAESSLHLLPNRSVNGWRLHCEAWTDAASSAISSREILVNVSFPPDKAPVIDGYEKNIKYRVIESDRGAFSCSVTGGNPLATLSWNCFSSNSTTTTIKNNTVKSDITWIAMRNYNACSCETKHLYGYRKSTSIDVDVLYPPTKPLLTISSKHVSGVVHVVQNNTLLVVCVSGSNPSPNYSWSGPHFSNQMERKLKIRDVKLKHEGQYECTAANRMVRSNRTHKDGSNASSIIVKVLYPPGQLKFRYEKPDGHIIRLNSIVVVKGDTFSIYCDAIGYPPPAFNWDNHSVGPSLNFSTITSDANTTCTATNRMNETVGERRIGNTSATLSVTVLYPPDIPKISVSTKTSDKIIAAKGIDVTETETVELECYSNSRPAPSYTWFVNETYTLQKNAYKLVNISRNDAGMYTCRANNVMNRTFGMAEEGNLSLTTLLNILYPSDVGPLSEISVTEASKLNITCPVIPGNPPTTGIVWTRKKDNRLWKSSQLIISNITREDDTVYTCTVSNKLIPTVGNIVEANKSSEFHLNVFFPATIKIFSEYGNESKQTTVVNETEEVLFVCTAEANPASDINITSPQNEQIAVVTNKNTLRHAIQNTSYENAGEYICVCRNNYTDGHTSSSKMILIVRSPPKLSSDNTKDGRIATTLHADVTLKFTARDYLDEPNKTMFIWFKENASIENDESKFVMSSNGLQSNLSISNITQTDFGKYGVRVSNSVGQYIHLYELVAKDKPEVPINFIYINGSVTDSSVTLKWMPGFYGGYPQTFILLYKKITEQQWQNKSTEDTGNKEMNYTLYGLLSATEYQVKAFARNIEGDSAYTENLQFITKAQVTVPAQSKSSNAIGIVAGSVSSSVIIITTAGIIVLVLIYRKRNSKENGSVYQNVPFSGNHITTRRKRESLHMEETLFEGLQEVDDVPIITKERTEYCNSPDIIEKIDRIKVNELFSYVSGRSEESFEADYQKLPAELQKPCTFARKPENIALNRYNGIYPYDHSRVKLHGQPDFFINACYIDGYKSSNAYIASLGPTAKTTNDFETFWKMIWYERVDVIVMLTNLREPSGMKCEKYWPEGGASIWYGDVCVSSEATESFAEYTIRQFSVYKEEERRSLTHLHYTAWPDKTVPEDVTSLIEFRQRMKTTPKSSEGPIVVHCSAGIGRTGTLIALDRLIEEGQDNGSLNVFECVDNMREQRVKMVQTFEQYMYIYKALVNALTFDCEIIPVETFNEYVDATNNNMYSMMFQQLRQSVETDSKADVEARWKNEKLTNRNRLGADIPGYRFRALLYLNRADEGSEYINAVYINSFVKRDYFIAAQSPLPCTVADFITLVYQEDCSCIVTMEDLKDPGMTVGQYLPDDKKTLTVGNFKVSSSRLETKHNYVVRKMKIKYSGKIDSGEKTIYHFQYTKWMTGHDTPVDAREFVRFVNEVKEYANELGEERSHVIVHCLKANERSGLFCALAILMEKIKLERQVNVLNTLRHLRTRRQTAITSMEQVKFCYQATSAYIQMTMLG